MEVQLKLIVDVDLNGYTGDTRGSFGEITIHFTDHETIRFNHIDDDDYYLAEQQSV